MVDINYAACLPVMLLLPHLVQNKGNVVNVSSLGGHQPLSFSFGYSVAKGFLSYMTKCMSMDLIKASVRVNAVSPGPIVTNYYVTPEEKKKVISDTVKWSACGKTGQPEDVANTIVFLASDAASHINGQDICIDGGDSNAGRLSTGALGGRVWCYEVL